MKPKYLMWHCTATPEGMGISAEWLYSFFTRPVDQGGRGWRKPGYRTVVHIDGSSSDLIDYDNDDELEWKEVTYGARGFNRETIHLAYVGGVDAYSSKIPKDTRTFQQKETMEALTKSILSYHPEIKICGHYQVNPHKACPSFNVNEWLQVIGIPYDNILHHDDPMIKGLMVSVMNNMYGGMFDIDFNDKKVKEWSL
jgi:hypothetical protein